MVLFVVNIFDTSETINTNVLSASLNKYQSAKYCDKAASPMIGSCLMPYLLLNLCWFYFLCQYNCTVCIVIYIYIYTCICIVYVYIYICIYTVRPYYGDHVCPRVTLLYVSCLPL